MARLIKVGIIGCGGIANGKHMPSLKRVRDCEMVAFCDIVPERAEKAAQDFGVPGAKTYTDYKELLADPELIAIGFSHITCLPACRASIEISACSRLGVRT